MKNFTSALTIVLALIFLSGIASGKRVEAHIMVRRYSQPFFVLGKGPTQSIITLLKQEWAAIELLEWSDWAFLPFDKCGRICSVEIHQILFLASRND